MAVIGIIVFCGVVVGAAALLLNRPERPPAETDLERGQGCAGSPERVASGIGRNQNERQNNRKRT